MLSIRTPRAAIRTASISFGAITFATSAHAHEAWLLTPDEIVALAMEPIPAIFTSYLVLGLAAVIGCIATMAALFVEEQVQPIEARLEPTLQTAASAVGPLVLRLGLAIMLALAATGGLPRHGTAMWTQPTLLVPDMQLSLVPGWDLLVPLQIGIAILLAAGLFTRVIGAVLIGVVGIGLAVFGSKFMAYAPHFAAPALVLILVGSGPWALDQIIGLSTRLTPRPAIRQAIWRLAQILVGGGFVYLAVVYKLTQPTLLIAILQHGEMPTFGLSYPVIALIMTGVEIICGALLIAGRLIRPVSLVIIGAITFLAVVLGETPLFHANLYGTMLIFALAGRTLPASISGPTEFRRVTA